MLSYYSDALYIAPISRSGRRLHQDRLGEKGVSPRPASYEGYSSSMHAAARPAERGPGDFGVTVLLAKVKKRGGARSQVE